MTDYTFWLIVWGAAAAGLLLAGCWHRHRPRNRITGLRAPFLDERSSIERHRRELALNHRSRP